MAVEDAYELAYRDAVRALEHQRAMLTELRGRAGMLLATASIAVSLLGQDAFRGVRVLALLAVACFALLSVSVLVIVWPHAEWNFDIDAHALLVASLSSAERDRPSSSSTCSPSTLCMGEQMANCSCASHGRFASARAYLPYRSC